MKPSSFLCLTIFLTTIVLSACRGAPPPPPPSDSSDSAQNNPTSVTSNTTGTVKVKADVWADNWFAFYLGDQFVKEDSVSITTERSFNSETFTFNADYPLSLNFVAKDYKENDTGLEYISTDKQQMGDGGLIAQFTNADTGEIVAVTDSNWACTVIHEAPLDKACEKSSDPIAGQMPCGFTALDEPTVWKNPSFDDSTWQKASVYSESQVSPKEGYDQISWDSSAQLIWGPDLETNNTILCRLTVTAP